MPIRSRQDLVARGSIHPASSEIIAQTMKKLTDYKADPARNAGTLKTSRGPSRSKSW